MTNTNRSRHILVVEDEYYIAEDIVRTLRAGGFVVTGPVSTPVAALTELDRGGVDFAVLDLNLEGAISYEVAATLRERDVPFLFLTGYDVSALAPEFQDVTLLRKPHDGKVLLAEIKRYIG